MTTTLLPRTVVQQERASERITAIVTAAAAVYKELGRDRFNTTDVAARAGCSIGTLYRYFEDRVALMDAIAPDRSFL